MTSRLTPMANAPGFTGQASDGGDLPPPGSELELMAYYDGELPLARAAAVEARLRQDPGAYGQLRVWGQLGEVTRAGADTLYRRADGLAGQVVAEIRRDQSSRSLRPLRAKATRRTAIFVAAGTTLALAASFVVYMATPESTRRVAPVSSLAKPARRPGHDHAGAGFEQAKRATASATAASSSSDAGPSGVEELQVQEGDRVIYGVGAAASAPPVVWIRGDGSPQP